MTQSHQFPRRRLVLPAAVVLLAVGIAGALFLVSRVSVQPAADVKSAYGSLLETSTPQISPPPRVADLIEPVGAADQPDAQAEPALAVRFTIPALAIDAPVVEVGLDGNGNMASPEGPDNIGWYAFTTRPGAGGNAVFSGHVDWYSTGAAVLWRLREVVPGQEVQVALQDGALITYQVAWARTFTVDAIPMDLVLETLNLDAVTIITCAGSFVNGDYTDRLVVRALRTSD